MATRAGVEFGFRGEHRLRKTDEFSSVFAFRRSLRSEHFDVAYRPRGGASARLGMVIGKKFARTAVLRNLLKRLARESFRHLRSWLAAYDVVLRLRKRIDNPQRQALREEIDDLLQKLARP